MTPAQMSDPKEIIKRLEDPDKYIDAVDEAIEIIQQLQHQNERQGDGFRAIEKAFGLPPEPEEIAEEDQHTIEDLVRHTHKVALALRDCKDHLCAMKSFIESGERFNDNDRDKFRKLMERINPLLPPP